MKVTGATTLSELGVELAKFGITRSVVNTSLRSPAIVHLWHDDGRHFSGKGETIADAFDDALSRAMHTLGAEVMAASAAPVEQHDESDNTPVKHVGQAGPDNSGGEW